MTNDDQTDSEDEKETSEVAPQATVKIPEQFQTKVEELLEGTNRAQLEYIRSAVMEREKEVYKSESKAEKSDTFDTEGMPE